MNIKITSHARERWVQRIVNPSFYSHIDKCKLKTESCSECISLYIQTRDCVNNCFKGINREILRCINSSVQVVDPLFLKVMEEHNQEINVNRDNQKYYRTRTIVFVISHENDDNVLLTVMPVQMIDGSIIKFRDNHKDSFHSWKFRAKLNGYFKKL